MPRFLHMAAALFLAICGNGMAADVVSPSPSGSQNYTCDFEVGKCHCEGKVDCERMLTEENSCATPDTVPDWDSTRSIGLDFTHWLTCNANGSGVQACSCNIKQKIRPKESFLQINPGGTGTKLAPTTTRPTKKPGTVTVRRDSVPMTAKKSSTAEALAGVVAKDGYFVVNTNDVQNSDSPSQKLLEKFDKTSGAASINTTPSVIKDDRVAIDSARAEVAIYKQWMIGANDTSNVSAVISRGVNPNTSQDSFYNLKGLANKKFLQRETQGRGRGIDIGWSEEASAQTASLTSSWVFVPKVLDPQQNNGSGIRDTPLRYGEAVAIGWWPRGPGAGLNYSEFSSAAGGHVPTFLTFSSRTVGPNLEWSRSGASYEWVIIGGVPGEAIRRGQDLVILYNLKTKRPLLYGSRTLGAQLGFLGYSALGAPVTVKPKEIRIETWQRLVMDGVL